MIEVFNNTNIEVSFVSLMKEMVKFIFKKENCDNGMLNIIFVDNEEIHNINKKYRGIPS